MCSVSVPRTILFSKPDVHSVNAQNEYDKFFQQPMELLAYSGVLSKEKKGNRNIYSVKNYEFCQISEVCPWRSWHIVHDEKRKIVLNINDRKILSFENEN